MEFLTPYINESLLSMSHNKCAYCELMLGEEVKYMEVEHFYCKKLYPDGVVQWDNLLHLCNRCNTNKGIYDTKTEQYITKNVCAL